ncbi:MAG TPA: hypothetical protein VHP12_07430, partial [Chitinophagaceae bacterium]|nr:hypothetical protein [Chitinophagaceae bacterium]
RLTKNQPQQFRRQCPERFSGTGRYFFSSLKVMITTESSIMFKINGSKITKQINLIIISLPDDTIHLLLLFLNLLLKHKSISCKLRSVLILEIRG